MSDEIEVVAWQVVWVSPETDDEPEDRGTVTFDFEGSARHRAHEIEAGDSGAMADVEPLILQSAHLAAMAAKSSNLQASYDCARNEVTHWQQRAEQPEAVDDAVGQICGAFEIEWFNCNWSGSLPPGTKLYTHPAPVPVSDAMVEAASQAIALEQERDEGAAYAYKKAARAALTAALTPAPNGREVES